MTVIIHDLNETEFTSLFPHTGADTRIIGDGGTIRNCIGCFGCWVKTPGDCVLKDGYDGMGALLSRADEVVIISKCCYGGFSPFVRNILDRSLPYLLPYFVTKRNETHHTQRYAKTFRLSAHFYGDRISPQETDTARKLVKANCVNFYAHDYVVSFSTSAQQLAKEVQLP